jgi:hypothetical protein
MNIYFFRKAWCRFGATVFTEGGVFVRLASLRVKILTSHRGRVKITAL